jgi:hypothetical protein
MTALGNAIEKVRAEARAAWLAERPPREKPTPDEIAGLDDLSESTAPPSRNRERTTDHRKGR